MTRYAIILGVVLTIVFALALGLYFLTNRGVNKKNIYMPKSGIIPGSEIDIRWHKTKYQHNSSKSNGEANIFNEIGECKLWNAGDKILNGTNTNIGEFPCMALLEYQVDIDTYSFDCAGSLISHRYVITAAHCLDHRKHLVNVRLGEYDIDSNPDCDEFGECQPDPVNVGFERLLIHENYSTDDFVNDIGLIRLSIDIPFTDYFIRPICIPDETLISPTGKLVEVFGWGNTGVVKQSAILQKILIEIFDWEQCRQYFAPRLIYRSQLCAGGKNGRDACHRDSGGPLVVQHNLRTYIEGIVSYGEGCGKNGVPGIYTRVGYYHDWIKNNLEP